MVNPNYRIHGCITYIDGRQSIIILIFMAHIDPQLLERWKKQGELLTIFRCPRCFKKIPFYKTNNELINSIYLFWVREHEYCPKCEKIIKKKGLELDPNVGNIMNPEIVRIIKKYEPAAIEPEIEEMIPA